MTKTIELINDRIKNNRARVVTAAEMTRIVRESGPERAAENVDVVTTGTFGAMCSSGAWLNFGHSDPPIRLSRVFLNDVEAYGGVAAVDAYLGATQASTKEGIEYGGAHVIEDLVSRKPVVLRGTSRGTDCYPRKSIRTEITIDDLNQAVLSNPRNAYQRYNAAVNTSDKILFTYMGKLLPRCGNVNFSGAGELSPLMNDPEFRTIGIGTKIFLGGGTGHVIGSGTQHSPENGFATLMVQGDLKGMSREFLRAAVYHGYGCTLYVGIGIPIPVLDASVAAKAGIADEEIQVSLLDYSVPSRRRPALRKESYAELKSGSVEINGRSVRTASLSSLYAARRIAGILKGWIESGAFLLNPAAEPLSLTGTAKPMVQKAPGGGRPSGGKRPVTPGSGFLTRDESLCHDCGACLAVCPSGVFRRDEDWKTSADVSLCTECGQCENACPVGAIRLSRTTGRGARRA